MSLIKNLITLADAKEQSIDRSPNNSDNDDKKKPIVKTALDIQRLKLEKLMKNPEKQVIIPDFKKEKDYMQSVPTFVRNVMGSSAGAGSGEFHVYRHLRRKEYARQKMIQSKSQQELLDDEYQNKLEENRRKAEEKTAKKRAKRLKRKNRLKKLKQSKPVANSTVTSEDELSSNSNDNCSEEANEKDNFALKKELET